MRRPARIALLLHEHALALDFVGPSEVFSATNREIGGAYQLEYFSPRGGLVSTASGLVVETVQVSTCDLTDLDTLIAAGSVDPNVPVADADLVAWIARAAEAARRTCSVCTGAFLLAQAGLLDGRRAVTHWDSVSALSTRFPQVRVELDPIYVNDGPVWTSAGITAGIDLALALVEADHGRSVSLAVAKTLVVFLHRPGGQAQFSRTLATQVRTGAGVSPRLTELHVWLADRLGEDLGVERLAAVCGMTPRTFARQFTRAFSQTPAKFVQDLRVEAACRAIEEGTAIKTVAGACGFLDEERMRRAFLSRLGITPSHYRARFVAEG